MKTNKLLTVCVLAVALLGCGKRDPQHIVILLDVSGSIDRESLEQAFKAIDGLADHLQRGDKLTVIPILGDAEAESSGRILRFEVPIDRQAYDADLRSFRSKLNTSLKGMWANAVSHPGAKTDILGSIELAEQEFQMNVDVQKRILFVLSDLIQEDSQMDFRTDKRLNNRIIAQKLAAQMANSNPIILHNIDVYLGLLKSNEYTLIPEVRRTAIKDFWIKYFGAAQATIHFVNDGPEMLEILTK
jgi:hypothetical protein